MDAPQIQAGSQIEARRLATTLPVYLGTIFFSAFLLFGIQPMFAKMVLPRLGGSPGVWSVAMVFFQTVLLAGYGYAHWLVSRFTVRQAALIHISLMVVVLLFALPIGVAPGFDRPPSDGEIPWLLALFGMSVGLPFFAVSANGPLLQAWFARTGHAHAKDPYFLYAASNVGSFLALIAYPFAIEPFLALSGQASSWAWGFGLLLAGIAACAGLGLGQSAAETAGIQVKLPQTAIAMREKLVWAVLAFVPSGLLVAVTAHVSTDVAAAPLLWVVPLALFLLTFVIVFQRKPILPHAWMLNAQLVLAAVFVVSVAFNPDLGWGFYLALHLGLFFLTAMVAHGELAKRRPDAANLTQFYFWMSIGGVFGGLFSGLLAPIIFNSIIEYPVLVIAGLLCRPGFTSIKLTGWMRGAIAAVVAIGFVGIVLREQQRTDSVRSFFGVNRIFYSDDGRFRMLFHGSTMHGAQKLREPDGAMVIGKPEPLTYYFSGGAIADGIDSVRQARGGTLAKVSVIGVGTGSLACQIHSGEDWNFYEIDAHVVRIATDPTRFSFFSACAPATAFVLGDARLTLGDAPNGLLDLLVVDAFSSDAIPVHLLTREAIALYLTKLKPNGVVLFHTSNRNMELGPVVTATARVQGLTTWIREPGQTAEMFAQMKISPQVAIVARQQADVGPLASDKAWIKQNGPDTARPWRDDYADIVSAIWRKFSH
ncbi:hypothetical protein J2Y55_002674 [Bosea sp. BE125]|uniref:fused MFS/spermidine synthase n=1 Tax=Bosea sp. BE125 TaxID=2817909 RepID=UPI00286095A5|nr:fused MFS/spermidine synthase [Bosea sp. BE125]MDR6871661.1 hypothetical protein [Bosea sp. BE125]